MIIITSSKIDNTNNTNGHISTILILAKIPIEVLHVRGLKSAKIPIEAENPRRYRSRCFAKTSQKSAMSLRAPFGVSSNADTNIRNDIIGEALLPFVRSSLAFRMTSFRNEALLPFVGALPKAQRG